MNKRHKKTSHKALPAPAGFPGRLRKLITTLALPSMLGACAAQSPQTGHPGSLHTRSHILPAGKPGKEFDLASQMLLGELPVLRLPSEIAIVESVLARRRADEDFTALTTPKAQTQHLRGGKHYAGLHEKPGRPLTGKGGGGWERIRGGLALANQEHDRIEQEVSLFARSPRTLEILSRNAEPFLAYLTDELEKRGLPTDLVIVPMIESAFQTTALSPKKAAGIWQLMPETGLQHGLQLTDSYDGRYDIHASTRAALDHLTHLKNLYSGDWLLALAAYNAGEGTVNRAIETNQKAGKGASFWDLNLPNETESYVPKIVALCRLISDPQAHGVHLPRVGGTPPLARIQVDGGVPLASAAGAAGMSSEEFYAYNAAFKPGTVPPAPFNLLLPLDRAEALVAQMPQARLVSSRRYVVKRGDTLVVIAKRHGIPQVKLALWNGLKTDSPVTPGQQLEIFPVSRT
jgi:membrane-bound lytic murein transglycosylase D